MAMITCIEDLRVLAQKRVPRMENRSQPARCAAGRPSHLAARDLSSGRQYFPAALEGIGIERAVMRIARLEQIGQQQVLDGA